MPSFVSCIHEINNYIIDMYNFDTWNMIHYLYHVTSILIVYKDITFS